MNQIKLSSLAQILTLLCLSFFFCESTKAQPKIPVIEAANKDSVNLISGVFDIPELKIYPSPNTLQRFTFSDSEKVIDYDVSPVGLNIACLIGDKKGENVIKFWQLGQSKLIDSLQLPRGLTAKAIAWHPQANALFIMGVESERYMIFKVQKEDSKWVCRLIYSTQKKLRRLVVCPRPFITNFDYNTQNSYYNYRLFFGMENDEGSYRIVSITETGKKFYQVIGPANTFTKDNSTEDLPSPSDMESSYALPVSFHPAGHQLIWQDEKNTFYYSTYDSKYWGKYKSMDLNIPNKGTITPTPNGLGLIHWQKDQSGIGVYLLASKKEEIQLKDYQFISTPSSTPDGKGIVGLTYSNNRYELSYLPINVPLADVPNAWMFASSQEEIELFQKNFGLFRPNQYDQLYELYESENYYCNGYDRTSPTRPYLVTTDIFWELFSAAYEGIFIVKERDQAIPAFWKFVTSASDYFQKSNKKSVWKPVFDVLKDLHENNPQNKEVVKILNEKDDVSQITSEKYDYSDLKPRGHYTTTEEMKLYFRAFRYFTTILQNNRTALEELNLLPNEVKNVAAKWIESYSGFIAPSRSRLVWDNLKSVVPSYCKNPLKSLSIFPLSWGFDNEVLNSTVFHTDVPKELQLPGRMLPSGLDLAAALGDGFAEKLLEADFEKYPNLRMVINNLKTNFKENVVRSGFKNNLYSGWLDAMAIQWADDVSSPNDEKDAKIWHTKRLQTGLATWATLRHASILVNERTAAECGEGGFEEILMRAPRGYVEPDPATFGAIADLFEKTVGYVSESILDKPDLEELDDTAKKSLYDGIIFRLKEVAKESRLFQKMAQKELNNEALTNKEYEEILFIARVAEHNFLVFNSLSNKDYALSIPDPMPKIADVSGGGKFHLPYLMVGVGNSMEWDNIVPFFGRHEIVKGSTYSYYEFESNKLLNDNEWRENVTNHQILPWIKPFVTSHPFDGMAKTLY